jgi:hypothetical protein
MKINERWQGVLVAGSESSSKIRGPAMNSPAAISNTVPTPRQLPYPDGRLIAAQPGGSLMMMKNGSGWTSSGFGGGMRYWTVTGVLVVVLLVVLVYNNGPFIFGL